MKNFSGVDKTLPALERSFKAAAKLNRELPTDLDLESIPLMRLSFLADDIHAKTVRHHKIPTLTGEHF